MDKIDKAILRELNQVNCRASYRSLARKFGLSPNTVKNRVTKMIEQGVILKFCVSYIWEQLGYEPNFGLVFTDGTENSEEFVLRIGRNHNIWNVLTLSTTEGGAYFVWGGNRSPNELAELGAMLRGIDEVQKIDLHMAYRTWRGSKIEFSKAQLKVYHCLKQDPRMRIEEISKKAGMATKTVRRILRELEPRTVINYHCRVDLSAGGLVDAFVRVEWDDKMTSLDEMSDWIKGEYSDDLWDLLISSTDSVMFVDLMLDSVLDLERISNRIREAPFVKSAAPLTAIGSTAFKYGPPETLKEEKERLRKQKHESSIIRCEKE